MHFPWGKICLKDLLCVKDMTFCNSGLDCYSRFLCCAFLICSVNMNKGIFFLTFPWLTNTNTKLWDRRQSSREVDGTRSGSRLLMRAGPSINVELMMTKCGDNRMVTGWAWNNVTLEALKAEFCEKRWRNGRENKDGKGGTRDIFMYFQFFWCHTGFTI